MLIVLSSLVKTNRYIKIEACLLQSAFYFSLKRLNPIFGSIWQNGGEVIAQQALSKMHSFLVLENETKENFLPVP